MTISKREFEWSNDIPFKDNTFDVVFANYVLQHFRDISIAFTEIHRVLRNEGSLVGAIGSIVMKNGQACLYDTEVPLLLGSVDKVLAHDFLDSEDHIRQKFVSSGFYIAQIWATENSFVEVEPRWAHIDKVEKLKSLIFHAKK